MSFIVETPRLEIRAWQPDDRAAFTAFTQDAEMMRYITAGQTWKDDQIDGFFERAARNLAELGFCMGAVTDRSGGQVIGVAGLQPHRNVGDIEVGWWIGRDRQGAGLASEAGAACLAHGFTVADLPRIVAIANPDNGASLRVMEKIGMRYLDTVNARLLETRYPDEPVARYVITREEWQASHGR